MPGGRGPRRWGCAIASRKPPASWIDQEIENRTFVDERLGKRFRTLLEQLSDGAGESIPMACRDWANTKAAYRFFDNERVNEKNILAGHFQSTRQRFLDSDELALVLHDTTEFCFHRNDTREIGKLTRHVGTKSHPSLNHIVCGILMHLSLVVTADGLDGEHTIEDEMQGVDCKGLHRIEVRDKKGDAREAVLELRYRRIKVLPPIAKQKRYPPLELTVIHAKERDAPQELSRSTGS